MRLYNFIIQQDGPFHVPENLSIQNEMEQWEINLNPVAPLGMNYLPVVPDKTFALYDGVSHTRDEIVDMIRVTYDSPSSRA